MSSLRGLAALAAGLVGLLLSIQPSAAARSNAAPTGGASLAGLNAGAQADVAAKPAALQQLARSLVAGGAPGAIVYVRTATGVRSATAGVARLRPRAPMRVADRYRIGSITKTFVATVVLELAAEGKLGLDDPVERWLPGLVPDGAAITLRQLLNHSSGLFDYADDQPFIAKETANPSLHWTPLELLGVAFVHPPNFPAGSAWAYSNTGYILLGLVIEAVTGEKLDQVLDERIFRPLRLRATSFPSDKSIQPPVAHGYYLRDGNLKDLTPVLDPSVAWAAGQMVSRVADLSTFFAALLQGRLVPAPFLSEMKPASPPRSGWAPGLGLLTTRTRCGPAFGHGGDIVGWHNEVLATANGRRVAVVMVNYDSPGLEGRFAAAPAALCSG
jgi:D-alanyl-D-alanine carboxypeptidase